MKWLMAEFQWAASVSESCSCFNKWKGFCFFLLFTGSLNMRYVLGLNQATFYMPHFTICKTAFRQIVFICSSTLCKSSFLIHLNGADESGINAVAKKCRNTHKKSWNRLNFWCNTKQHLSRHCDGQADAFNNTFLVDNSVKWLLKNQHKERYISRVVTFFHVIM